MVGSIIALQEIRRYIILAKFHCRMGRAALSWLQVL